MKIKKIALVTSIISFLATLAVIGIGFAEKKSEKNL